MIYISICSAIIVAGIICHWYIACNKNKDVEVFNFRTAMELLELPVITLYVGERKLHFLLDTGTDKSIIDEKVLNFISYKDTGENCKLYGLEGTIKQSHYVNIDLKYNDSLYTNRFQVVDMSEPFKQIKKHHGITLHGFLGTEFFNKYKYVIDFEKLIAYHKKK